MKITKIIFGGVALVSLAFSSYAQQTPVEKNKVIVTGVRFTYPLLEKWISAYETENPSTDIVIESRTTTDPAKYDLLIEAYEPDAAVKDTREYLYLSRYALLPIANTSSAFARVFGEKGLNKEWFNQIYFSDVYADKKSQKKLEFEYTVYTRLQKAGAPITFAKYFGFEQANIKGKAISGADEHLIKALLKDTTGVSYNVPGLIYNLETRKPVDGLTVIPVDLDGNNRVSGDERIFDNLDNVLSKIESEELKNIPTAYLHLSIAKSSTNAEAFRFLQWVMEHSQDDLHAYGFLKPDPKVFQKSKERINREVALN